MEVIWSGKLPAYWSIANWALLTEKHIVVLFRDMASNKRKLRVVYINDRTVQERITKYNALIGSLGPDVLLTKVEDARAHDQLSFFGWLNLDNLKMKWELLQSALIEKFSIPYTLDRLTMSYSCGLMKINLITGDVIPLTKPSPLSGIWNLGEMEMQHDSNRKGLFIKCGDQVVVQLNDFLGSQYQGALGDWLFFLLPSNDLVCIEKKTGNCLWKVYLNSLTRDGRPKGKIDYYNETCYRNSFIANILINRDTIVWATDRNEFYSFHIPTGKKGRLEKQQNQFLVDINNKFLLTLTIDEELEVGNLTLFDLEEFFDEYQYK